MATYKGYILTRECLEDGGRRRLHFTGIGRDGPFEIVITNNRPLFFIPRGTVFPQRLAYLERRQVDLTDFTGNPVDAVYFRTQNDLYRARDRLKAQGTPTFEADVRPEERFLMERFIHGGIEFEGDFNRVGGIRQFVNPRMRAKTFQPQFSVLSLDIETGQKGELYSIAGHFQGRPALGPHPDDGESCDVGVVLLLDADHEATDPPPHVKNGERPREDVLLGKRYEHLPDKGVLFRFKTEKKLLTAFLSVMGALDPDIIIGWHVIGFDLMFLENKYKAWGLPFAIGRAGGPPRIFEVRKGVFRADIPGRIVIDGPPALRAAFYSFENFRLETVASELLGQGKDIDAKTDKVAEIERRYQEDKKSLASYNLQDCRLVSGIFSKTGLVDLTFKRAFISGLPMDRVGMSVAAFDFFMLPRMHRHGVVAPNVQDVESTGSAAGGWVFVKSPGFYEHVAVFDFKSLYPSIIRTFKIDPLSRLRAYIDPLDTPVGTSFSRTEHILPAAITELMAKREQAKKDKDPHLSQAIKILMNSFYGVMGTPGCRFHDHRLPAAITGTGQWVLKLTRDHFEKHGYDVLYGDTDSVFVQLKRGERFDADKAVRKLVRRINTFIADTIKTAFGLESHLELEFERHFMKLFIPALRGGGEGAKKRYVGLVAEAENEELVFTGLEFVRSDWTRLARNFQYDLFDRIFHDREVIDWIRGMVSDIRRQVYDDDLIYRKRLRKAPAEYVKVVPPHVKAARLLGPRAEGLKEIRYVMTQRGPIPQELPHDDLDYTHYIEKQLKPIADAVLQFLGLSFSDIVGGRQLTLFP
ncbi:MAG: DNA polymerase II [Thermodesulfobacteriota bacterium]